MKYRLNHIKQGYWVIYQMDDLRELHKPFYKFYCSAVVPRSGELSVFLFSYDKRKGIVRIKRGFKVWKINLLKEKEFAKDVYLLLDTLAATGLVSAPFYKVDVKITTATKDLKKSSVIIYKGGIGAETGYYRLRGLLV